MQVWIRPPGDGEALVFPARGLCRPTRVGRGRDPPRPTDVQNQAPCPLYPLPWISKGFGGLMQLLRAERLPRWQSNRRSTKLRPNSPDCPQFSRRSGFSSILSGLWSSVIWTACPARQRIARESPICASTSAGDNKVQAANVFRGAGLRALGTTQRSSIA